MRAFAFSSTSKHSGPLMSSRLMPPKVGSSATMMSTSLSTFSLGDLDVEHVDAGEFLEQDRLAFHHRLAGERADGAEAEHGGAVGEDGDEILARGVDRRAVRDRRRSPGRGRRRPANRRAPDRAGWRAAWSRRSRAFPAAAGCENASASDLRSAAPSLAIALFSANSRLATCCRIARASERTPSAAQGCALVVCCAWSARPSISGWRHSLLRGGRCSARSEATAAVGPRSAGHGLHSGLLPRAGVAVRERNACHCVCVP